MSYKTCFLRKRSPFGWLILPIVLTLCLIFLIGCGAENGQEVGDSGTKQLYTCGMHPQVIVDEPGLCPICNMKLTPLKTETAMGTGAENEPSASSMDSADDSLGETKGDKKILHWRAPMDPTYISDKPGKSPMGMDLIPVYEGEEASSGATITIDPVTVQNIGVRTAAVKRQPFNRVIRTVGHVDYSEERLVTVNLKFNGWIETLHVSRTGDAVKKGEPLFEIYSPDLVATQEEYLLAHANQQKLKSSSFAEVSLGARSLLKAARQRLEYWDISDADIEKLERSGEVRKTLTIHSPATGIVLHKNAIEGDFAKAGEDLFRIADLSTVWVYAHIFEYELPWIKVGQSVQMALPYMPGRSFQGSVDYIYPYLDSKTRDVKIRLVFRNPELELKPQMYANISIDSKGDQSELVIPSEAIIRSGTRNLAFLNLGNGRFRPQEITIGPEGEGGMIKVMAGLQEGQEIVTSAQFLLDSESRLREAIQKMLDMKTTDSGKAARDRNKSESGHRH